MNLVLHLLMLLFGYLLGSLPVGLLVVRAWTGTDVRTVGSGRTGGTNVYRAAGIAPALLTVVGDGFKGIIAVLVARYVVGTATAQALAGLGAVAGHNWSLYIRFAGGAGTMTNLGSLLALSPMTFVAAVVLGAIGLVLTRYASVGSITVSIMALVVLLVMVLIGRLPPETLMYGVGQAAMILYSLRPNIVRLLAGTERRVSWGTGSGVTHNS